MRKLYETPEIDVYDYKKVDAITTSFDPDISDWDTGSKEEPGLFNV